ncbi:hypothetical protein GE21DRAFT_6899 [Neurospora crassa]|uniref:Uncharacterized protein n=1 Tax=Neurospora crassa (strain ATCC 24698 / 74-OR23-1A / CBS 708.71 / DSM 1257 / FGSC 987) TaxID=367110 RepID=A7UX39_NEUCR|nr:hypothetical protein NCU11038 [Neurospora crassa OR74A]EDO65000.1 hypothetical protein NCU11038 [Neurospora crassa OR74A]KHE85029.1 hypothetical protein GE21DRAFT_6899 [Neurospora crassa]|eukprot:XP_001728091.1 hypothetical protein NCU11038 [Neurospora crassa OR74A]
MDQTSATGAAAAASAAPTASSAVPAAPAAPPAAPVAPAPSTCSCPARNQRVRGEVAKSVEDAPGRSAMWSPYPRLSRRSKFTDLMSRESGWTVQGPSDGRLRDVSLLGYLLPNLLPPKEGTFSASQRPRRPA